jgi:signal transduction histidine kinase
LGEDEGIRKDGTTFNYIISARIVLQKQKALCIMAVFTDITERKRQENIRKENEVNLLKLNNDKDKFFSIISHDLRSPFNGMLGLLEILADDYSDYSDEERLNLIQASHASALKAFNLLSDLLEWARLQNNKVHIENETIDLREVLKKNITLYLRDAEKKDISIRNSISQNTNVTIDVNSLTTIVRNLLINAIKFTPNGGSIELNSKQMQNHIELSIKDTGVGMTPDTIDRLFRLDENFTMPGTNNEKGTGLGLIICNDLLTLNAWKMNIKSEPGHGTTFKILIPK